jgi:hypothetical protein
VFEDLIEASHIVAGMGVSLDEALEIVKAAHEPHDEPPLSSVVYGVDFRRGVDRG